MIQGLPTYPEFAGRSSQKILNFLGSSSWQLSVGRGNDGAILAHSQFWAIRRIAYAYRQRDAKEL